MKRRRPDGFTLLELLLSISLVALITGVLMGGIHLGRRSWETGRASETLDEAESVIRATRALLIRSFVVSSSERNHGALEQARIFLGASDSCRFIMLSDGGAQWGGLIVTEISIEKDAARQSLVVWTKPYRPREGFDLNREAMKKTVVADGLGSIQLSYYGLREQMKSATWGDNWNESSDIPALVSVKIILRRMGHDIETSSIVALPARASSP